jgi:hypothetical protein
MTFDVELTPLARLRPGELLDELSTEEGTVVLVGRGEVSMVVRLSPLGQVVLAAVRPGLTLVELESEVRSRLGEPEAGDASSLVRAAVMALLETAVLAVDPG